MVEQCRNLILILGDQLSENISSLADFDQSSDAILMSEVWEEATYVKHHKKKLVYVFSAMRHFAETLKQKKYNVIYTQLQDKHNQGALIKQAQAVASKLKAKKIIVTEPAEYRLLSQFKDWSDQSDIIVEMRPDNRFLATHDDFQKWAKDKKSLRMEFFYREMRRRYNILMDGDDPIGGEWNYDKENRKVLKDIALFKSAPVFFKSDKITNEVIALVDDHFPDHFGETSDFHFAVTRRDALLALDHFIKARLPFFGDYQDMMLEGEPFMYHSILSMYINSGLLLPIEVIQRAEQAYHARQAPLNAVEGFIRQILGWREYIRGIYWLKMPDYKNENALNAEAPLPNFYWTAETKMNCLKNCVQDTYNHAYAHHIQRLMVLGNFALLAGIHPDEVNNWYMLVYADAYEWVELPNVSGMVLYADDGVVASKPYIASGAYINKMSNYCQNCFYDHKEKFGERACPFNFLYWAFLKKHENHFKNNPRMAISYNQLKKMPPPQLERLVQEAQRFLSTLA